MSFTSIKPYFQARISAVDPDMNEWTDGFNVENIPSTILDKSWHLGFGLASQVSLNQDCLRYSYPVTLNVFLKGYRSPAEAIDKGNELGESILREVLKHANRLSVAATPVGKLINVLSNTFSLNQIADSNDNVVRVQMEFTCDVYIEIE